ncbi:MAG TPA: hypothetical protein VFD63_02820 [Pyrinomonadaceae bacterium]|nr:hypothetical protein [Pyrinomonadaceae bacterium]
MKPAECSVGGDNGIVVVAEVSTDGRQRRVSLEIPTTRPQVQAYPTLPRIGTDLT